ncbi:hypothetical protein GUITHDRAFT_64210, partial [Guillardia theta CCMP2712]
MSLVEKSVEHVFLFSARNDAAISHFAEIHEVQEFWKWFEFVFVPITFLQTSPDGSPLDKSEWGRLMQYNKILGSIRLEQRRARPVECQIHLLDAFYGSMHWIDRQTEHVRIVVTLYNGELSTFTQCSLKLKLERGGYVKNEFEIGSVILDPYTLHPASSYGWDAAWYVILCSVNLILIMIHFLEVIRAQPRLAIIVETFLAASNDIVHFLIVFVMIELGFASIGTLLFGHQIKEFATLWDSLMTCFELL